MISMKKMVVGLAALATLAASAAFAEPGTAPDSVFLKGQEESQWLAKDLLLTTKVINQDGQIVGDVEDIILDANNQIVGVIIGTGGFVGFGEKPVGVRISALEVTEKDGMRVFRLPQATKETLAAIEPYQRRTPPKALLDRAMEKARELSSKTAATTKDAYEKAKEKAAPAFERAKEAAKEAYERAKEAWQGQGKEGAAPPAPGNGQSPGQPAPAPEPPKP